jgi:cell fate (sporulation/competence/biofilm development) regulator YlbF (YheA/YmcA/DUF963 family)
VEKCLQAKALVDSDEELSLLVEEQARIQSRLQSKRSEWNVIAADLEQLHSIQQTVKTRVNAYLEAQKALYLFIRRVNWEISQLAGFDFISLAGRSGCC